MNDWVYIILCSRSVDTVRVHDLKNIWGFVSIIT